jgi:hypothetical protein
MCWQDNMHGVIKASVANTYEAFERIHVEAIETLAPCHVWMEGSDLPHGNGWRDLQILTLAEAARHGRPMDLRILINHQPIFSRMRTHVPALTLLALAASTKRSEFPGGFQVEATLPQVVRRISALLQSEDFVRYSTNHVQRTLQDLVKQVRQAGGMAYVQRRDEHAIANGHERNVYGMTFHHLPYFLSSIF